VLPDDAQPSTAAAALEIEAASYNSATGLWNAQPLTDNSYLDRMPQIAAAGNNTALVVWVANEKNDAMARNPEAPNTIQYCFWNGSAWTQPAVAATGIGCMLKTMALAYDGTHAVYVYGIDADWDCWMTDKDEDLYALMYDGVHWSQPIRLTNDAVTDANPQVVYDHGEPLLVWYKDGSLVSCRNLDANDPQQVMQTSGLGSMDFRLAKSPNGQISLVWTEISAKTKGFDVFTATHDPFFGVWSNSYVLTSDQDTEKGLAATYVGSGELALAYNKDRIGDQGFSDVSRTDLCVLRHVLGSDLAVGPKDISLSVANPAPGSIVQITAVVHNLGDVAEANVPVAFYHGDPYEDGVQIGDFQTIAGPIPAGGTGTASVSWTVPQADSPQQVYVAAFVVEDPNRGVAERDWANNIGSISVMAPDLMVRSVFAEGSGDEARTITATIANVGVIPANNVNVVIRRDSLEGELLKSFTIPVIDANSVQVVSFDWDISAVAFEHPQVVLFVAADPDNTIVESQENNNTGGCLVQVGKTGGAANNSSVNHVSLYALMDRWLDPSWLPSEAIWHPE
jgi:hypothetical protein